MSVSIISQSNKFNLLERCLWASIGFQIKSTCLYSSQERLATMKWANERPMKIRILYHVPESARILEATARLKLEDTADPSLRMWNN